MSDAQNSASAGQAGSAPLFAGGPSANNLGGQPPAAAQSVDPSKFVDKAEYEKLSETLGKQGEELGDYRKFLTDITPLLEELQKQPALVEQIIAGKLDQNLVTAIAEGRVEVKDAAQVAQAHAEVKKELGKNYATLDPQAIEKMVEDKVKAVEQKLTESVEGVEDKRKFENKVNEFIESVDDFPKYAGEIEKWFEEHPEEYDIETAYYAVKGRGTAKEEAQKAVERIAEEQKNLALNAGGGFSQGGAMKVGEDAFDSLVAPRGSPNRL